MTFDEYDKKAAETAVYKNVGKNYIYPTFGLASEAGEVAGKVKKLERDLDNKVGEEERESIKMELGDVLWYVSRVAAEFGFSLEEIAKANVEKLAARKERNALHGNGDNR